MFDSKALLAIAGVYVLALFVIAAVGDRLFRSKSGGAARATDSRPWIYALSIAVYCTSWTFFGSVGLASTSGWDFVPIYIGPIILFTFARPLLVKVIRLAKTQNLTSAADFIAARYGKSQAVATVVTLVAVIGTLPYIALQLKAIVGALSTMIGSPVRAIDLGPVIGTWDIALPLALVLALFSVVFGTRQVDATEHQNGLMLAIAAESVVKLTAFLAVGGFVVFSVLGGFSGLKDALATRPDIVAKFTSGIAGSTWLTFCALSFFAALLLPRQFHVTVVENKSDEEIRWASWLFPLYLVLINLFVVPIAIAGLLAVPAGGSADADQFVLAVPIAQSAPVIAGIALIGGLSAATAMVIVDSIALAIMVSNGLVVPLMLRLSRGRPGASGAAHGGMLLAIRRTAIVVILVLGYACYSLLSEFKGLVALGLLSFAAIAQLAPAFLIGLFWRGGTARGTIAGITAGFAVWSYTLILPALARGGQIPVSWVADGPFGLAVLKPEALLFLHMSPLTHGVFWSLLLNTVTYILVSRTGAPSPIERLQAAAFVDDQAVRPVGPPTYRVWNTAITARDLKATVAGFLGAERVERAFERYARERGQQLQLDAPVDPQTVKYAEHLLTSAIGAASSRLVLSLLFGRGVVGGNAAMKLFDDASEALRQNRDLLQNALDHTLHGLGVFDKDMRLIAWNRQYRELLALPRDFGQVGTRLDHILRVMAARGDLGAGSVDDIVADRIMGLAVRQQTFKERIVATGRTMEIKPRSLPQGGLVITYQDITDQDEWEQVMERQFADRTVELRRANLSLDAAKRAADHANFEKTRLLLGANHDLRQPFSAARLYVTSLAERELDGESRRIVNGLDTALGSLEEILDTLIEISKIDSGRVEPELIDVEAGPILEQLAIEFRPIAERKGLALTVVPSSLWLRTDPRLLRRVLQNLISNAIRYTPSGRVLLGARPRGGDVVLSVVDTGPGIPDSKRDLIFQEFQRLDTGGAAERGLGLGLSIVDRIARMLSMPIELRSIEGRGAQFSVLVPAGTPRVMPEQPSATTTIRSGWTPDRLDGQLVLCLDNDPTILASMSTLLTGWGCDVLLASNRDTAVRVVLERGAPSILLVDFHLNEGEGTGFDIARELRFIFNMEIPTIVITADQTPEVDQMLREQGFIKLPKPVRTAQLRALMTQLLLSRAAAE